MAIATGGTRSTAMEARSGGKDQHGENALLVVCAAHVTLPQELIPSMEADKIVPWGDAADTEAEAVRTWHSQSSRIMTRMPRLLRIGFGFRLPPPCALASP
jgi:hypothetical protein